MKALPNPSVVPLRTPFFRGERRLRKELSLLMIFQALVSVSLSVGVALLVSGAVRLLLEGTRLI